jgi:hypothetical protein
MFGNIRLGYFYLNLKKLDLEITGLVFQEYLKPLSSVQHKTTPLLAGLLEQAKVISRCPNKHPEIILSHFIEHSQVIPLLNIFYTLDIFHL